jgi:hypothetical protein
MDVPQEDEIDIKLRRFLLYILSLGAQKLKGGQPATINQHRV